MTPERWHKIEEIFQTVVAHAPTEQAALLTQHCGNDVTLRQEIEALLGNVGPDDFLHSLVSDAAHSLQWPNEDSLIGQRIGTYRIVKQLGQGGMGAVYLAERDDAEYFRQVALKVVKRGMDTRFVLHRFRVERQILATLEHPNIAQLLDGGTTADGLPYFVMEYVAGKPLIEYSNERALSLEERLRLFLPICAAVQHAHQKLIVHRDLKPSNILVTAEGAPKLLDFGIAKLLDPSLTPNAPQPTITSVRLMTPDYASPEQVRGLPITTASDVYSLGAVLYELLTGERPHQIAAYTPTEIERAVCDTAIERPSTAAQRTTNPLTLPYKQLIGDLDNIVLMALRKEPERRYQSVEQFAEDIRRFLAGRPISARNESVAYRANKFVRRNKFGVAAAVLVLLSLVGALAVSRYQTRRAERRFQEVRKLANTFLFDFYHSIEDLPGSVKARELVAKTAVEYLDSLAQEASGDNALQLELAEAYQRIGDVQGYSRTQNLGQSRAALESYDKSLRLAAAVSSRDDNIRALYSLSHAYIGFGDLTVLNGDLAKGLALLEQGLPVSEKLWERAPQDSEALRLLTRHHMFIGDAFEKDRRFHEALAQFQRTLSLTQEWQNRFPSELSGINLALCYGRMGGIYGEMGDYQRALENLQLEARMHEKRCYGKTFPLSLQAPAKDKIELRLNCAESLQEQLRDAYSWLGNYLGHPEFINAGQPEAALAYFRRTIQLAQTLAAADPENAESQMELSYAYSKTALVLAETAPAQAVPLYRQALAATQPLLQKQPNTFRVVRRHAYVERQFADALIKLGDQAGARQHLQAALTRVQALRADNPTNTTLFDDLWHIYLSQSQLALMLQDTNAAAECLRLTQATVEQYVADKPSDLYTQWANADLAAAWGHYYSVLGASRTNSANARLAHWRSACEWQQRALDQWHAWNQQATDNAFGLAQQDKAKQTLIRYQSALAKLDNQPNR